MIHCTRCDYQPDIKSSPYCCPICGGYFDYQDVFDFDLKKVDRRQPGIWRYRSSFDLPEEIVPVSLGEGDSPLIWDEVGGKKVGFKLDYINPTLSYKDRGTSVLVSVLKWSGVKEAIEDSSGNAGASFAAYSSSAGIRGRVYVPDYASGPKRSQIEAYGSELVPVAGPRSNASEAVKRDASRGFTYASHVYQPYVIPGYATAAYEIFEQSGGEPGSILLPAGQGTFLLGIARGFQALLERGLISRLPQMVGVQSQACAPLYAAYQESENEGTKANEGETVAEGIRILHPLRKEQVLAAVTSSWGWMIAVEENEILPGRDALAKRGFHVEPTSAVVWPALITHIDQLLEPIVVVLTGSGLKYPS